MTANTVWMKPVGFGTELPPDNRKKKLVELPLPISLKKRIHRPHNSTGFNEKI